MLAARPMEMHVGTCIAHGYGNAHVSRLSLTLAAAHCRGLPSLALTPGPSAPSSLLQGRIFQVKRCGVAVTIEELGVTTGNARSHRHPVLSLSENVMPALLRA